MSTRRWMGAALAATALATGVVAMGPATAAQAASPNCTYASITYGTGWGASMYTQIPVYFPTRSFTCGMTSASHGSYKSVAVKHMQNALRKCYGQKIDVDGYFGPKTKQALKNVQAKVGIKVDGAWGPQTSGAIRYPVYTSAGGYQGKCYARNFFNGERY
ncbi:peptidoglycan-binding domain-containing protein [Terrabacter sp. NPDC000476]|uniref:peptidoglycan-binding domain-containing protein n=1 Tax=Terrabacter sp. NPDC000476 TaxID=3154258 RepID=UPI00332C7121